MSRGRAIGRRGSPANRRARYGAGSRGGAVSRARGFTLLEVMLAFAMLAFAMGLLIGMLADGLHQVSRAEGATEATLYAQSMLDPIGTLEPIAPGDREGYFQGNRYHWRLHVAQAPDPAPRIDVLTAPTSEVLTPPVLYRVVLDVSWGEGKPGQMLHFATLRARASEQGGSGPP
jgi:general secretion pathway protein I